MCVCVCLSHSAQNQQQQYGHSIQIYLKTKIYCFLNKLFVFFAGGNVNLQLFTSKATLYPSRRRHTSGSRCRYRLARQIHRRQVLSSKASFQCCFLCSANEKQSPPLTHGRLLRLLSSVAQDSFQGSQTTAPVRGLVSISLCTAGMSFKVMYRSI